MEKVKVILLALAFSATIGVIFILQGSFAGAQLTGGHVTVACELCHGEGVWHTTQVDKMVCKGCHGATWTSVSNSKHVTLLKEGTIVIPSGEVKLSYCATCHSPHHPDYLWVRYTNGTVVEINKTQFTDLCVKCHAL